MLDIRSPAGPCSVPQSEASSSPDDICRLVTSCVAFDFGLDVDALNAGSGTARRAVFARQIAMYLAHVGFGLNFEIVGQAFGRDRTTVAHACRVIEDSRDDIWFDCRVATLELVCRAAIGGDAR